MNATRCPLIRMTASLTLLLGGSAFAAETPRLSEIRARYLELQSRLDPLSVAFSFENSPDTDGSTAKSIDQGHIPYKIDIILRYKGSSFFHELTYAKTIARDRVIRRAMSYDGRITRILEDQGYPQSRDNILTKVHPGNATSTFPSFDAYLSYQGLATPRKLPMSLDDKYVDVDVPKFLGDAGVRVEADPAPSADGTPCVVVTSDRERLWLDPQLNFAQRQHAWHGPGGRGEITRITFADHTEARPGLWLPRSITRVCFPDPAKYPTHAGKPFRTEIIRVAKLSLDPPGDDLLTVVSPPGFGVFDMTQLSADPKTGNLPAVLYTVPTAPVDTDDVIRHATEALRAAESGTRTTSSRSWLLIANIALIAVVAAVYLVLSVRRRRSTH